MIIHQHSSPRAGGQAHAGLAEFRSDIARKGELWQDAEMPPAKSKKKLSKFGKAALEVAEDIANLPLDGAKEIVHTAREIKNKQQQRKRAEKSSAKADKS